MTEDIVLTIPSSLVQEMKLPPDTIREELMSELAISLYQQGIITSAQACRLSGLERFQFEELLWKRQIPAHYSEEVIRDINNGTITIREVQNTRLVSRLCHEIHPGEAEVLVLATELDDPFLLLDDYDARNVANLSY